MNNITYESIIPLIYKIEVNKDSVSCHFVCPRIHKEVISIVPLEPQKVDHHIRWRDRLLHPLQSWRLSHHKKSNIYGNGVENSVVVKAFKNIASHFTWSAQYNSFVYE